MPGEGGRRPFFLFAFHCLKPLKFVLGLPKWKFLLGKSISCQEKMPLKGPHRKLLTGPFSLNLPLDTHGNCLWWLGLIRGLTSTLCPGCLCPVYTPLASAIIAAAMVIWDKFLRLFTTSAMENSIARWISRVEKCSTLSDIAGTTIALIGCSVIKVG